MNKAFIFDLDGVLVNSEPYWTEFEEPFFQRVFGKQIAKKVGHVPGRGVVKVYEEALSYDAIIDKEIYLQGFEEVAMRVYDKAPLTSGVAELVQRLTARGFKLCLVTQSPQSWIDRVLPRLPFKNELATVVSTRERNLEPKPSPEGFLIAFSELKAHPRSSFILEDSNFGIAAGKAAGAFVIGFRGNLLPGYEQHGADAYADTMDNVINLVEKLTQP